MLKLLWKEWHEQSWKLAFGCLVLGALALIGLRSRLMADQIMSMWICFLGITLLPVLSSTGLVPAERGEGTLESLLALPVTPWRILLAKSAMGVLLCAGPMIVAGLISLWVAGNREMSEQRLLILYARSTVTVLCLFIWMLALTIRLPGEARGALLALGLLILWMLGTAGLAYPSVPSFFLSFSPFVFVYGVHSGFSGGPSIAIAAMVQILMLALIWRIALGQFQAVED